MTVFNLGSINIDLFYQVPHFPAAGETLTTLGHARMLGGKGANQSIALARAGMDVLHLGASSAEDSWLRKELEAAGVNIAHIQDSDRCQRARHCIGGPGRREPDPAGTRRQSRH